MIKNYCPGSGYIKGLLLLFFTSLIFSLPSYILANEPTTYSEQERHTLSGPSVLRVLYNVNGKITVYPFWFDLETFTFGPHPTVTEPYVEEVKDQLVTGTAFSIDEEGVFVTNAHVVSMEATKTQIGAFFLFNHLIKQGADLLLKFGINSKEYQEYKKRLDEMSKIEDDDSVGERMSRSLLSKIKFENKGSSLVLLPQDLPSAKLKDLLPKGQKVKEVIFDKDWIFNEKDVALLRVDNPDFKVPALAISPETSVGIDTPAHVYGFPGSTDISTFSSNNYTVTQGRVTSIKKSQKGTFDILQIDSKIGPGSSGGPLVDSDGKVIGIVSMTSTEDTGDNFGFALPIALAKELYDKQIKSEPKAEYQMVVREGLFLKENRHCKLAIEEFKKALALLPDSSKAKEDISGLITACTDLINQGLSIDTKFDEIKDKMRNLPLTSILLGVLVFLIVLIALVVLVIFVKKKKTKVESLDISENRMERPVTEEYTQSEPQINQPTYTAATPVVVEPQLQSSINQTTPDTVMTPPEVVKWESDNERI